MQFDIRYDGWGRLRGIGVVDVTYRALGGRPRSLGSWPLVYGRRGLLAAIGPFPLGYDRRGHHPCSVGSWPVLYTRRGVPSAIGPFALGYERRGRLRTIGSMVLHRRRFGRLRSVEIPGTWGGLPDSCLLALFLVLYLQDRDAEVAFDDRTRRGHRGSVSRHAVRIGHRR